MGLGTLILMVLLCGGGQAVGSDMTVQDIVSKCRAAYRDCSQLVCTGSQTVSLSNESGKMDPSWSTKFSIKYLKPDRLLFASRLRNVGDVEYRPASIAIWDHIGVAHIDSKSGKRTAATSIQKAVEATSIGEGPYFVLELLFQDGWSSTQSFPPLQAVNDGKLLRKEVFQGTECYVLSRMGSAIWKWPGGPETFWISTDRFMVQRVFVESLSAPSAGKITSDTVFKYDHEKKLSENDFRGPGRTDQ